MKVDRILDWLFPPRCLACGRPGGSYFCRSCRAGVRDVSRQPTVLQLGPGRSPLLVHSWGVYAGGLRLACERFKYARYQVLGEEMGSFLADKFAPLSGNVDLIVPIPLHPGRQKGRGFNQAEVLARQLALAWQKELAYDLLSRIRDTQPLYELAPADRRQTVAGAFRLARPACLAGRRVLLVDDILTTGATLAACAKVLCLPGGVRTVAGLTLARA